MSVLRHVHIKTVALQTIFWTA